MAVLPCEIYARALVKEIGAKEGDIANLKEQIRRLESEVSDLNSELEDAYKVTLIIQCKTVEASFSYDCGSLPADSPDLVLEAQSAIESHLEDGMSSGMDFVGSGHVNWQVVKSN